MPSKAFSLHLEKLLGDAEELESCHAQLRTGAPGRQYGVAALNRSAVVISVSAWESYIEELMRESMMALQPAAGPTGMWHVLNAHVLSLLKRFNTPNAKNVKSLIEECIGLPDIKTSWHWKKTLPVQAVGRLEKALDYRHQIAHGVNPRPVVHHLYSSALPEFFRRLARCTDGAVRQHLIQTHGLSMPWPP